MRVRQAPLAVFVVIVVLCVAASASAVAHVPPSDQGAGRVTQAVAPAQPAATDHSASGQVVVRYKSGVTAAEARSHAKGLGATVKKQIVGPAVPHGRLAVVRANGLGVQRLIARYEADPRVEYAEPDYLLHTCATPNDTRFWELWGMQQIRAPEAWDVQKGSADVVVADIDTGVNYRHPDLWYSANVYYSDAEIDGITGVDDDGNGYVDDYYGWDAIGHDGSPGDGNGHGTHAAGTIAARGNNAQGVTGVCWYTRIMACRFLDDNGDGYTSDAVECVDYVVAQKQHGVNVVAINASWGGDSYSTALRDAITAASNAGIVFVAAAGNDGANNDSTPFYPANYNVANVISVAAVDSHNRLAWFSNYGTSTVDLAAPGVDVLSTVPTFVDASGYAYKSGTSMAAPHVTGAIALCAAAYPSETMAQRIDRVVGRTAGCAWLWPTIRTAGVLDVARALDIPPGPSWMEIPGVTMTKSYTTGALGEGNDEAVYRVFLTKEQMTARITNATGADYDLYLFGPGTATVADKSAALASATGGAYPKELTYAVPANGVYYLNVSWVSGSGEFGIACNSREDDIPGVPFSSGDVVPWIDDSAQFDAVRSIHVGYGETLTSSIVSPPADSNFELYLFPPEQFSVWLSGAVASVISGDYPRTLQYPCWKSGTYYVDAHAVGGGGWFTLTHSVAGAGDNDIPGSSIPGSGYSSSVSYALNRDDVFQLPLFPRQTVTVNLSDGTAGTDMDLYLFGPDATTVEGHSGASASSATGLNPESLTFTTPPGSGGPIQSASTYYVDINAVAGDGAYTLTYSTLYDTTAPTTTAIGLQTSPASGWQTTSQDVTLKPADTGGSGLAETCYTVDGFQYAYSDPFTVSGSGSHVVTYWSTDNAANGEPVQTGYVNIDTSPPQTWPDGLTGADTWRNTAQTVTLKPSDLQSGVAKTYYILDDVQHTYDGSPFEIVEPGRHEVTYWSIDHVGNEEKPEVGYVNIDIMPPAAPDASLSPSPSAGWNNGNVNVTLLAGDKGGSGVQKTQYSIQGSGVWTDTDIEHRFTVPGPADHGNDGAHVYDCRAVDNAGNTGTAETVTVNIDTSAPVTTQTGMDGLWHRADVTAPLAAADASSGIASTEYKIDGATDWSTGVAVTISATADHLNDGEHTAEYRSVDLAGNVEPTQTAQVFIDTRKPTPKAAYAVSVTRGRTVKIRFRVNDVRPGSPTVMVVCKVKTLGGRVVKVTRPTAALPVNTPSVWSWRCRLAKGTYRYFVYATDAAGNPQSRAARNKLVVK